jgi:uncharacterized protein YutE (UPF0331/DUF86 family)
VSHEERLQDDLSFELGQIRKELAVLDRIMGTRNHLGKDEIKIRAAASSLQSIYNGIEGMLRMVLKSQNIEQPHSMDSHSRLLGLASSNGIISVELENKLRELMTFRHFYRHSYGFMIDDELMDPLLMDVTGVVSRLAHELRLE